MRGENDYNGNRIGKKMKDNSKDYNKWQSRRWLITVWAMLLVSIIVISDLFFNVEKSWMTSALQLLLTIIGGYIASETVTKINYYKKGNNDEENANQSTTN